VRSRPAQFLLRNRSAKAAALVLLLLLGVAVFAPALAPYDPAAQELTGRYATPSAEHWLGQDEFGRDVLSRLIFATRTSLWAAAQALTLAVVLGIPLGLIAGYAGRWVDAALSRIAEALLAMPPLILALAIVAALGPNLTNAMIALGIVIAPTLFRIARAAALGIRTAEYIEATRSVGCSRSRILLRHVMPNAISPLIVQLTFAAGGVMIAEASLSFLGLGAQAPTSSWGSLVRDGYTAIYDARFLIFPPSIMIIVAILAFTVLGDALRDAFGAGE
jgi:peptide/nickel transport system permease protein